MNAAEINFDGLIGPSHNYSGLSLGNLASANNAGEVSRPKAAALQGLAKMRLMMALGLRQGILLPHLRPHIPTLHALGYRGAPEAMMAQVWADDPALARNLCAASAMWTANAATISPGADTHDGRVHVSPANLVSNLHRALEADFTSKQLHLLFADPRYFSVHAPLPMHAVFGDEGAANHGRLCQHHGAEGVELFVYGDNPGGRFPARQTLRASQAIVRRHGVRHAVFVQQASSAIEAGAFHNDVVSVANQMVLFTHEGAFEDKASAYAALRAAFPALHIEEVPASAVPMADAIRSYLFNSMLVTLPDSTADTPRMALILPSETQDTPSTKAYLEALAGSNGPIAACHVIDVRESMRNGGGPACLRLRVALRDPEVAALDPRFLLTPEKADALEAWINDSYPDEIAPDMLGDPLLHRQFLTALDRLQTVLRLPDLYGL